MVPRAAHTPTISYNALRRARTTIEDFVLSYFPYHGLNTEDFLSKYWDTLVYVEATIYQLDEENEEAAAQRTAASIEAPEGSWSVLLAVLSELNLLDHRVEAELAKGKEYWRRERKLCAAMAAGASTGTFDVHEVHAASQAKSFDYRVLHLLLHQLVKKPYDEAALAFLVVDEHLVDIGDDLYDYEDDVFKNSFNIFRAYVHLYGTDAQMRLIARISQLERQHEALLAQLPSDFQQQFHKRHWQAAAEQGNFIAIVSRTCSCRNVRLPLSLLLMLLDGWLALCSFNDLAVVHLNMTIPFGVPAGADKWQFPDAITDEAAYKARFAGTAD